MSWQCINEITYIDDTLVTCAEYQLFIDEMRAQGDYYQPDHWSSYDFPLGQARKPILGMRLSDAQTFCAWLTKREPGEWNYRLPTTVEAKAFHISTTNNSSPLGYWVTRRDDRASFYWINNTLNDPRNISQHLPSYPNSYVMRPLDLEADIHLAKSFGRAASIAFAINHDLIKTLVRTRSFPDREKSLDIALVRTNTLVHNLNHLRALNQTGELVVHFRNAITLYVDIFTLQERIAGRSPAFEGIRLVKERNR